MSFFDWLITIHLIGDWLSQTEYQALNKAEKSFINRALLTHCAVYAACFIPLFWYNTVSVCWVVIIFCSHLFIDRRWPIVWICRYIKRCSAEELEKNFWLVVVVDQVVHILILASLAVWHKEVL